MSLERDPYTRRFRQTAQNGTAFSAGRDLSGTSTAQMVVGWRGRPLSDSEPSGTRQAMIWNGTLWLPGYPGGLRESGGTDLSLGAVADGQFIKRDGEQFVGAASSSSLAYTYWDEMAPPTNPSAYDIEGNGSVVADWGTLWDPGSVVGSTVTERIDSFGRLRYEIVATPVQSFFGRYRPLPGAGTAVVTGGWFDRASAGAFASMILLFQDVVGQPNTTPFYAAGLIYNGNDDHVYVARFPTYNSLATTVIYNAPVTSATHTGLIRVRVTSTTTVDVDYSRDGKHWRGYTSFTAPWTIGHIGVGTSTRTYSGTSWPTRVVDFTHFRWFSGADAEKLNPMKGQIRA